MPTSSHRGRLSAGTDIGAYFPDHPPTWLEVGLTLLVLGTVVGDFLSDSVLPAAAVAGFLLFVVVHAARSGELSGWTTGSAD